MEEAAEEAEDKVETAIVETKLEFAKIRKEAFKKMYDEMAGSLDESVRELLLRYLKKADNGIETERLFRELIGSHNRVVRLYKDIKKKL